LESIDWKVIPVTARTKADPQFAVVMSKYAGLLKELARVIGRTSVQLNAGSAASRTGETNVGNLVTDAFRKATNAEIGFMNGGSVRADALIGPGPLTRRDLLSILPFKNKVVKLELSGAALRSVLEHGVARSSEDREPGRFPQVSGIKFSFDASRPAGSRVTEVTVNGQPLNDSRRYTLATTTFLAVDGGDGYTMFKDQGRLLTSTDNAPIDSDILARMIRLRPISPKIEGRIRRLDQSKQQTTDCDR
jgi:5'-nucleotidase